MTEIHEDEQQQGSTWEQTSTVATETAAEVNDEQADKKEGIEADASTDMLTPDEVCTTKPSSRWSPDRSSPVRWYRSATTK